MVESALAANGLTVTAADGRALVDRVDLVLKPGEVVGLTGAAGSGKSLLALALLGLARPPLTLSGQVMLGATDLLILPEADAARRRGRDIALVVQNPRAALHPMLPIGHQIGRIWRTHHRADAAAATARALEMLRLVGINDAERRVHAFAHELSGGMAQRALIAAALAADPQILIADEPTSGLDVTVQAAFLDMMATAARARGTAMLIVTQEPGILANYADRVLVMTAGRLSADRPVATYFDVTAVYAADMSPAAAAEMPVVTATNLSKRFPIRGSKAVVHAVERVDLSLRAGETLGLVGESGSGKTTTGRMIVHLIKPDSGSVTIDGEAIDALSRADLRRMRARVQFVLQDPFDSFDPRWSIARSLSEPLRAQGMSRDAIADRVAELIALVGEPATLADRLPGGLPAGTLQRLAIMRALAARPRVVVLDEPTSVLAPDARHDLTALLCRLQQETGIAFLFISHDLTTVAQVSHRVAVMYLGQIVELGSARQIFESPRHPYTRALIAAHLGTNPARRRIDYPPVDCLEGEIPSPIDLPPGCYLASRCAYVHERCHSVSQELQHVDGGVVRCWRAADLPVYQGSTA